MAPHPPRTHLALPSVTLLVAGTGEILDARGELHGVLPSPGAVVLWEALGARALAPLLRLALLRTRAGAEVELDVAADGEDDGDDGARPGADRLPGGGRRLALHLAPAGAGCSLVTAMLLGKGARPSAPGTGGGDAPDEPLRPQLVCGWCARVAEPGTQRWLELEEALEVPQLRRRLGGAISHGMCTRCADALRDA